MCYVLSKFKLARQLLFEYLPSYLAIPPPELDLAGLK